ncbi:hypothetical protein GC175_10905 [bacterium]|nr:hypothetical protein [bacterium]
MTTMYIWREGLQRLFLRALPVLLRVAIIVGLIGAAALSGLVLASGRLEPELVTAAAVAALAAVISYRIASMERGILAIALAGGLLNFFAVVPPGTQSRLVISLVLAMGLIGVWFMGFIVNKNQEPLKPSPINRPIWLFVFVSIVAYGWGVILRDPLVYVPGSFVVTQSAALLVNILLPLLALLVANKFIDLKWLRYLAWIMIGLGVLNIVSTEFNLPTQRLIFNGARGLFSAWVAGIAYALAIFDEESPLWRRGLLLLVVAVILYQNLLMNTIWLSGWVPVLVICTVVTFYRSKKLFAVGVGIGLLVMALNAGTIYQEVVVANIEEGGTERLDIWAMNLSHVAKHPFFGMGPAGYAVYNMTYHPLDARSTHNNYFDVLAQTGVIGFVAFLWLQWRFLMLGMRNCRRLAGKRNFSAAFAAAALGGAVAAMVAMMLGDWVLPFAYNQTISGFDNAAYTWIFLGGMAAQAHILDRGEVIGDS